MIDISPDHAARRVICASMAYYSLDEALLTDGEFDELCKLCVDRWSEIEKPRQFLLGSPEELSVSGYHVKVSTIAENATVGWLDRAGLLKGRKVMSSVKYKQNKVVGRWRPCTAFYWA